MAEILLLICHAKMLANHKGLHVHTLNYTAIVPLKLKLSEEEMKKRLKTKHLYTFSF